jgi:hypothetical protein
VAFHSLEFQYYLRREVCRGPKREITREWPFSFLLRAPTSGGLGFFLILNTQYLILHHTLGNKTVERGCCYSRLPPVLFPGSTSYCFTISSIREPILVRARKIFVLACTVQKHRNHLLSAPASCKFFALECAS